MYIARTSYEPEPNPDSGRHSFIYSVYPHKGSMQESDTIRKGYKINNKLIGTCIKTNFGSLCLHEDFLGIYYCKLFIVFVKIVI